MSAATQRTLKDTVGLTCRHLAEDTEVSADVPPDRNAASTSGCETVCTPGHTSASDVTAGFSAFR